MTSDKQSIKQMTRWMDIRQRNWWTDGWMDRRMDIGHWTLDIGQPYLIARIDRLMSQLKNGRTRRQMDGGTDRRSNQDIKWGMDGWMNGWKDERQDTWTEERTDTWLDGWTTGPANGSTEQWTNKRKSYWKATVMNLRGTLTSGIYYRANNQYPSKGKKYLISSRSCNASQY